ncbi:hypothetical protein EKE94_07660 [Mesobaculum littorinae]|uniref:DUF1127 domain-containing protein n=1 Tax=Mesobaculum littorinae TaxID=2486419 RepID=A0A438AJI5_9RHOB|nr:hypothetical protein [Mesobaculum littorinae]RVV98767.1 hypothetical protein EKE94_07660 [Mesobaculum littorinae]
MLTTHGTWRVLRALAASLLQPHRRPRPAEAPTPRLRDELSDHLRRDIGLPPTEPPPRRWHGPPC